MSALQRIAYFQNRRDEEPNRELARDRVKNRDLLGIKEIASNLWNSSINTQSDCLKVLYEVGYLAPELVAGRVDDMLRLTRTKNNRLVWGAMIALSTIARLRPDELVSDRAHLLELMASGSVITVDAAIKTLATVAASNESYHCELVPHLLQQLEECRAKDVPQHAESTAVALGPVDRERLVNVLLRRMPDLSPSQSTRVKRVIRAAKPGSAWVEATKS